MPELAHSEPATSSEEDCEAINTSGYDPGSTPTLVSPCPNNFEDISADDLGVDWRTPIKTYIKTTNSQEISGRLGNLKSSAQNFAR